MFVVIENEYQIDICMKIFNTIPNSYCYFKIDNVIERFNFAKERGFLFLLGIYNDGEIFYSIGGDVYLSMNKINFNEFIKKCSSEYRELGLNKILNDKLK